MIETVMSEFLPTSWTVPSFSSPMSVYGFPLVSAMKLLRVLATSGRHACARLVSVVWKLTLFMLRILQYLLLFLLQLNSAGVRERLSRLLSAEPSDLLLESRKALRITTEAYRMWAVAAGYGQACDLYMYATWQRFVLPNLACLFTEDVNI